MSESDSLSDQVKSFLQEIEDRNENRWRRDMKEIIEQSMIRVLEEVLTRKLQETGCVGGTVAMTEHRPRDRNISSRNVRSWAAEQVARTLVERPESASSKSESADQSTSVAKPEPRESLRIRDVAFALPCTPCGDVDDDLPKMDSHSALEQARGATVFHSTELQVPLPQGNLQMSVDSSSSSAQIAANALLEHAQDTALGSICPRSSRVGDSHAMMGHIPKAWDQSKAEKMRRFARASASTQSLSSLLTDSVQRMSSFRDMFTRKALSRRLPPRFEHSSFLRMMCATLVLHKRFDFAISIIILANAASMGVSADRQARDLLDDDPVSILVLERMFFILFVMELMLRMNVYRWQFFHGPACGWNIFDFVLVKVQFVEEVLILVGTSSQTLGFAGVLRLLRLVRIIRLARILRLIKELRVLVSSISNSMRSLVWTLVLMFLMIYSVSLCITELVSDKRRSVKVAGGLDLEELATYYGSLPRSMLSLFEAITGGVDWDVVVTPLLEEVHPLLAVVFVTYVAVALLAIMNVVTGVFVDSVLASARADKEQYLLNNAKELFATVEEEMDWEAFRGKINTPQMLEFFKGIDVDPSEAKDIFALIDLDQSGSINAEEFLNGCVRLQGPSKAIETAVLHQELRNLRRDLFRIEQSL